MKCVGGQQIYLFVADVAHFFKIYTCKNIKSLKTLIYKGFTLYHCDTMCNLDKCVDTQWICI